MRFRFGKRGRVSALAALSRPSNINTPSPRTELKAIALMRIKILTIVGVGLIGGSLGLAARRRGVAQQVIGYGRQQASLDRALKVGAINKGVLDLREAVRPAELVVFCTPVEQIAEQVSIAAGVCTPGTILTDVGSTKAAIVHCLEGQLPRGVHFIGSHPLAGSEKRGPEHAEAELLKDRLTVLTPTADTDPVALARLAAFWESLGSRVRTMSPEEHDTALAVTSHLPHLLASALAGILPPELHDLTASGFRDTTRVAAGDPELWTGIFAQNHAAVLAALGPLCDRLQAFRTALEKNDKTALDNLLAQGKKVRDALGN